MPAGIPGPLMFGTQLREPMQDSLSEGRTVGLVFSVVARGLGHECEVLWCCI